MLGRSDARGFGSDFLIEKIKKAEQDLSVSVAAKDWSEVTSVATRLKYLQGIEQAARVWPNPLFDH